MFLSTYVSQDAEQLISQGVGSRSTIFTVVFCSFVVVTFIGVLIFMIKRKPDALKKANDSLQDQVNKHGFFSVMMVVRILAIPVAIIIGLVFFFIVVVVLKMC